MPQQSYAYWYAVANSGTGSTDLASITDEPYPGAGTGTFCDSAYWVARGYDQIRAIYAVLGSSPGAGVDGSFTINQDNATNNTENSALSFSRGTAVGGNASLTWVAATNRFSFNQDLTGTGNLGQSSIRWPLLYATAINVSGTATLTDLAISGTITGGSFSAISGTTGETYTIDSDDTYDTAGTGIAKLIVSRGVSGTDAYLGFNATGDVWVAHNGTNEKNIVRVDDASTVKVGMLNSDLFAGSGGGSAPTSDWGTATTLARSDHSHAAGATSSTGTTNASFDLDSDYISGSSSIELRFAGATRFLRYNLGVNAYFEFSDSIASDTNNTDDLGISGKTWRDFHLGRNALIGGTLGVTGVATFTTQSVFSQVTGSSPFTVASTTVVTNLNADTVDGLEGASFLPKAGGTMTGILNMGGYGINMATGAITNVTITTPTVTAGTFSGSSSFTGSPTFSTGTATFSGTTVFSTAPSFIYNAGAPFSITNNTVVTNLNADTVDAIHGTALLQKAGGTMMGILNMGGYAINMAGGDINNIGNLGSHESSHLAGGSDALAGNLGAVTGVTSSTFGVDVLGSTLQRRFYFGSTAYPYWDWTFTSSGEVRLGGTGIHLSPMNISTSNQDLGTSSHQWRSAYLYNSLILNQISSDIPTTNGAIWSESGSPSSLRVKLAGTSRTIIDSNNKTDMIGSTGNWAVAGTLGITGTTTLAGGALSGTFTGNPTFSGNIVHSGQPTFTFPAISGAPFLVTSTTKVANLNADLLDDKSVADFLLKEGGTMTGILNLGGYGINMATGAISNVSTLGVTGVATFSGQPTFTYPTLSGAPFLVTSTALVSHLNADQLDGYEGSAFLQLAGGALAASISIPEGSAYYLNAANTSYLYYTANHVYLASLSQTVLAAQSNGTAWFYGDVRVEEGKKIYLDWDSNAYLIFAATGGGPGGLSGIIRIFIDGTQAGRIDATGFHNG